jgi:phosphatidylglycerophosphate synthase
MVSALILLPLAWSGMDQIFIFVLIVAFVTDSIDGPFARRFHMESEVGAKLDTCADVSIYIVYLLGAWWLWPDIMKREQLYISMIIAGILIPAVAGVFKFRQITSYHTWLVKIAAACMAVTSLMMLVFGPAIPFRIAAVLCLLAGLEEFSITVALEKPRSNVKSLWHILQK